VVSIPQYTVYVVPQASANWPRLPAFALPPAQFKLAKDGGFGAAIHEAEGVVLLLLLLLLLVDVDVDVVVVVVVGWLLVVVVVVIVG